MPFMVDESRITNELYTLLQIKKIPLVGDVQSNLRIPMGPLYYYLGMPALYIGQFDPRSLGLLNVFIGIVSVALSWRIASRLFDVKVACITALTFALSMAFVSYSNKPFPPALLLILVPLYYLSLWEAIKNRALRAVFVAGFLAGMILHVHISGIVVLPLTFILWIALTRQTHFSHLITLASGYLLALSPLIVFNLRHQFYHWTSFSTTILARLQNQENHPGDLIINNYTNSFLALTVSPFFPPLITTIALIQFGIGLYLLVTRWKKGDLFAQFLVLTFFITLLLTYPFLALLSQEDTKAYHLLPLAISFWLLQMLIVSRFWKERMYRTLFITVWAFGIAIFLHYHLTKTPDTVPLPRMQQVARYIAESSTKTQRANLLSLEDSDILAHPYRYFVTINGIVLLGAEGFGQSDAIYVLANSLQKVLRAQYNELYAPGPYDVENGWVITDSLKLYKLRYRHPGRAVATEPAWPIIAADIPL